MFQHEVDGLQKVIKCMSEHCAKQGYNITKTQELVEEKCRRFVDVVVPIAAVNPVLLDALLQERPTLAAYLQEKIQHHLSTIPTADYFEKGLIEFLEKGKTYYEGKNLLENDPNWVYDNLGIAYLTQQIDKFGFAQELLVAVHKVKPELMSFITHKYNTALTNAQNMQEYTGHAQWWA